MADSVGKRKRTIDIEDVKKTVLENLKDRKTDQMRALFASVGQEEGPNANDVFSVMYEIDTTHLSLSLFTKLCGSDQSEMVSYFVGFLQEHHRLADLNTVRLADGRTALFVAAKMGRLQTVTHLLGAGADHSLTTTNGSSPLLVACGNGHTAVVLLLTDKGANVNQARNDGTTPLWMASADGHTAIVLLLTEKGANINQADNDGFSPLFVACDQGHTAVVVLLSEKGANVNQAANDGTTPLFIASANGHTAVVLLLTEKGANINQARNDGTTPLHIACTMGHTAVVKKLLSAGADVNQPGFHQARPILSACYNGHDKVVSTLLAYGADVTPYLNQCPVQTAIDKGHQSCAELIRSWPALQNQNTAKLCIDKLKKQGYYDVVRRTADNDLPKHLFVFRVVEMMKMCGMEPLAEHLIGFVGTSPNCACAQCVQGGGS